MYILQLTFYWASLSLALTPISAVAAQRVPASLRPSVTGSTSTLVSLPVETSKAPFLPNRERLEELLTDPDKLISKDFQISSSTKSRVLFWANIYATFNSRQLVVYDDNHPEVIYEVVDYNSLASESRNEMAYEIARERLVQRLKRNYQEAFRLLKAGAKGNQEIEKIKSNIVSKRRKANCKHSWLEASNALSFQAGQRDAVITGLQQFLPLSTQIESVFESSGLPKELTRISLVESSFNEAAISHAGAKGVWQFMPAPGKEFLTINDFIDERTSPIKSSLAAARLLRRNFQMTQFWPFAITAYNHGHGPFIGLKGLTANSRKRAFEQIFLSCRGSDRLGHASRNYYFEFLAMVFVEAYRGRLFKGIKFNSPSRIARISIVRLPRATSAASFVFDAKADYLATKRLNPDIIDFHRTLPSGTNLVLVANGGHPLKGQQQRLHQDYKAKAAKRADVSADRKLLKASVHPTPSVRRAGLKI
jgi:membrane-bound lytic murein transglycosylase D